MKKLQLTLLCTAMGLAACGSNDSKDQESKPSINIPSWVMSPILDNGLASTECVKWSGNMSIDKKQAVANARAGLAKQIDIKVKAMDKTYARKTETGDKMVTSNVFESVSKQVTEQNLVGSRPERVEVIDIAGENNLCAMVTLKPELTQKLFNDLVKQSGASLSPQDETILFEEFKSYKAHQELDDA